MKDFSFEHDLYARIFGRYSNTFMVVNDSLRILDRNRKMLLAKEHEARYDLKARLVIMNINGKWGAVGENYEEIIPFLHDTLYAFNGHYEDPIETTHILAVKNGKFGFYGTNGELKIPFEYDWGRNRFIEYFMVKKNENFGLINVIGEEIIPIKHDTIMYFEYDMFYVSSNNKFGIKNIDNDVLIDCKNDSLIRLGHLVVDKHWKFYNFFANLRGDKWGLCDILGRDLIEPFSDTKPKPLIHNFTKSRSLRHIDSNVDNIIPEFYYTFTNEGKVGIVNSRGKIIIPAIKDSIQVGWEEKEIYLFENRIKNKYQFSFNDAEIKLVK